MREIAKVLQEVVHNLNAEPAEKTFKRISKKYKFEKSAVAAVYSWIYDKLMNDAYTHYYGNSEKIRSFRILSDEEISQIGLDRKSTRLNSSHVKISYAVFCLKKKNIAKLAV